MTEINALRRLRMERELRISDLAEKSGVNFTTISQLETGRRKAYALTIVKLAKALDVPIDALAEIMDVTSRERGQRGGRPSTQKGSDAQAEHAADSIE